LTEQEAKLLETLRTKMEIPPELTADILHRFDTGTTQRPKPPPLAAAPPRASNRAPVVIGSVVFIGVAALVGWLLLRQAKRGTEKAPFEPFLGDYTKAVDGADEGEEAAASLVGKVVVIDRKEQEVDDLQFDLPEEIRARQPEEVGTVVWLDWGRETQGGYTDGTAAYVQTCTVTVIHREKWEVLGTTVFRGSDPPSFKKGGGSRSGSKPTDEVVRFLAALPRY